MDKIDIFSQPELIDGIIKGRINSFSKRGGKSNNKVYNWTEDELELRNAVIYDYIAKQACSKEETARQIASRWDISMTSARRYVKSALDDFSANWEQEDKDKLRERYIEKLEGIMQDALEAHDRQSALRAQEIINKLNGLYEEKSKIEIEGNIPLTFDFS